MNRGLDVDLEYILKCDCKSRNYKDFSFFTWNSTWFGPVIGHKEIHIFQCIRLASHPIFCCHYCDTRELSYRRRTDSGTVMHYHPPPPPASFRSCQNHEHVSADWSSVQNQERKSQAANQRTCIGPYVRHNYVHCHAPYRSFFNLRNCKWGEPPRTSDDESMTSPYRIRRCSICESSVMSVYCIQTRDTDALQ